MKNVLKLISTVILFELAYYPLLYFVLLPNTNKFSVNLAIVGIRILGCISIGLWFAHQYRNCPINTKKSVCFSIVAGCFGLYYLLISKIYITLTDLIWWGAQEEFYLPNHFIRIFLSENLFDQWSVMSYMCLFVAFQLGRIWFSRRNNTP